ncbi:FMN-binding glutamate synthase family protein [Wohlfahrtiimonas chitiniclastica]|uniref:FMN-binding glutamate synthase family protein n=1 Tax=Wohlfahrtiimonas chitiniclastica TaxID=400946 RepID=UPI000B993498|nr:FMN-binding glutamate synthase family protein [Wohlfahrtiimonas chitiniclastica]MBS7814120.1 FMN-binding glutamate synthase family protein [Wohlfahrtiimonas chitiniclastica]MBS7835294.1 FMN-binding glutamate synthase family protein [Wohlfahrtiimonas chitiniclastica]OYQ71293.1 FMN-binding glutamate synthase family protein [Wohlfahrtiimonas chitiniclastica]OYQ82858.1 FMN-binding glutamate synthase family protein [Wohlfahrtiimonas chitiniclastica]OYQ85170.1 FMN-binding glutamate synthase famil
MTAVAYIGRYSLFILAIVVALVSIGFNFPLGKVVFGVSLVLIFIGILDISQKTYAVRRNYPILGNLRYLLKHFRPEIRQYFIESDSEAVPFTHGQRELVYNRSKNHNSNRAFGTIQNVYEKGFQFINHSMAPVAMPDPDGFRVTIGGKECKQPYSASIFNISAMSFGALSSNAVLALNGGAKLGNFAHDTGEGSISPYHLENGGDLIWELGSGYFGCRTEDGRFDPEKFREKARLPQVKMIEVKISQGAKPGHGGVLPKDKITKEIAETRGVPMDRDCISPATHSEFSTPIELLEFIQKLRELSDGKPVGFKLCIGHAWEFAAIVKAMLKTGILPDFIVVDGKEGGTGSAPIEFADHIGSPLREGLLFVHNTLVGANLRDQIKIGASGKIISAFDIARTIAIGADWVNSARGFMFALGCIQSLSCHTNNCPTGIATQDLMRQKGLDVTNKKNRVYNYHRNTLHALAEMLSSAGISNVHELEPHHLVLRTTDNEVRLFSNTYYYLEPGALLKDEIASQYYSTVWNEAQAESFAPTKKCVGCC